MLPITSPNVFSGRVLSGSLLHSVLDHGNFFNIDISQGSVATCLRCGGYVIITLHYIYNYITANLLANLPVKKKMKIGQSLTNFPAIVCIG